MGHTHASTASERAAWVGQLLAHTGGYGAVTTLSRAVGVSRQTLYTWLERGRAALEQAFAPPAPAVADAGREREILTLLVEGHASYRGIQRCLREVGGREVSLGTISTVVRDAQERALTLVEGPAPLGEREVVVPGQGDVLDRAGRWREADTLLALLTEARDAAPQDSQREVDRLHTTLTRALPGLLAFAAPLDAVQQAVRARLGRAALASLAWAWPRRALLGPTPEALLALLALLPPAWRPVVAPLLAAWEGAVRASSAVEAWHSVLRPHLAVHRTLSPGMLALLMVWHNHRVSPRGLHQDQSPLQRSGLRDAPTDWLLALGYPSVIDHDPTPATPAAPRVPLAA